MTTHILKVQPPYFDSIVSGTKTFEVRKNDRGYQRGDVLRFREWHPDRTGGFYFCPVDGCTHHGREAHWSTCHEIVERVVTFVYSGDPRFGGIEPGFVVLGLGQAAVTA